MSAVALPLPELDGDTTVEQAIADRESRRSFSDEPVNKDDIGLLLWAAQGITHEKDSEEMRAAPSAGATHPLAVYLEVKPDGVEGISTGVFRYIPENHSLETVRESSVRGELVQAAGKQDAVRNAPATVVI
ncbi:MAG: SagB/ThcOx family dehydrogenase, partial [Halobacteria archaeon]|nr:SagB/ThcOx family dehydrogenase [Halobacteria archaeon]